MKNYLCIITALVLIFFLQSPVYSNAAPDSVRVGIQLEPISLDPTNTPSSSTSKITYNNIFEGLTRIDRNGNVRPLLAKSWNISKDGRTYTFILRKNVFFHNGHRLTPKIVEFSLKRLAFGVPKNPNKELFSDIESIQPIDPDKIIIKLSEPNPFFISNLGLPSAVIVHPDSITTNHLHPVGTGPYRFVEWVKNDHISMEAYKYYWGKAPAIRHASFIFTPSRIQIESALAEGLVDGYSDGSGHNLSTKFAMRSDYIITNGYNEAEVILAINNARAPLNKLSVRRAIAYAINKQELVDDVDLQTGKLIGSHFSPRDPAYIDLSNHYPYNPQKAEELLAKAGVNHDLELTIAIPPTSYAQLSSFHIASQLEHIGIKIHLERLTWGEWVTQVYTAKDYDLTVICHVEPFDINIYAKDDYYFNYNNAHFKKLWGKIKHSQNKEERYKLLGDAQRMITEDCVNVFLYMKPQMGIWKSNLHGTWINAPIPAIVLTELRWVD